jgi:hypothetical protein
MGYLVITFALKVMLNEYYYSFYYYLSGNVNAFLPSEWCTTIRQEANSTALVRRTIPTEEQPLVGEVVAYFCG